MATFQGKRVSKDWHAILTAAWADGVRFQLNSGQRTMAEQWRLYRHPPAGTRIVAFPRPGAPHIKVGHQNHALDVNADGGQRRLALWLAKRGAGPIKFNVAGEPWHMDPTNEQALHRLAVHYGAKYRRLVAYRAKYAELKHNIDRRQVAGKSSPGQRRLLARYARMIRKLKR